VGKDFYAFDGTSIIPGFKSASRASPPVGFVDEPKAPALGASSSVTRSDLAKHLYDMRRIRDQFLPPDLFAEPGWDILLLLFWAGETQQRMSVTAVCVSAGVPGTTALRWIQHLVETGMVEKAPHPTDMRVSWLSLSSRAKVAVDAYLAMVIDMSCQSVRR
jgi:hypothetical protein